MSHNLITFMHVSTLSLLILKLLLQFKDMSSHGLLLLFYVLDSALLFFLFSKLTQKLIVILFSFLVAAFNSLSRIVDSLDSLYQLLLARI